MTGPHTTHPIDDEYRTYDPDIDRTISLRRATIERDLERLHSWLGSDHVKPYWDLDRPLPVFRERLQTKLADDHLTPYVGCLDHVTMSYWESYWAAEDDVGNHYDADPDDQGVHLLIGPEEYLGHGYASALLRAVVAMQFAHAETDRVIAEPDVRNEHVIHVFEQCGFEPRTEFAFEEAGKDALLLVCEREHFEREVMSGATAEAAETTGGADG